MKIKIGTRSSPLALKQTEMVMDAIKEKDPDISFEVIKIKTSGDVNVSGSLADIGGKALFAKEIEAALLEGEIDIAVHSMKDMETTLPGGLMIAAVLEAEDERDVLIFNKSKNNNDLQNEYENPLDLIEESATIASCSPRREAAIKNLRPDINIIPIRGNVGTRLRKIKEGHADATILAYAGIKRLELEREIKEQFNLSPFAKNIMPPAASQGIIGIECHPDNSEMMSVLSLINHSGSFTKMLSGRALLRKIDGSCRTAIGVDITIEQSTININASLFLNHEIKKINAAKSGDVADAEQIAEEVADEILKQSNDNENNTDQT